MMAKIRTELIKVLRNSRLGQLRNRTAPRLNLADLVRRLEELPATGVDERRAAETDVKRRLYG